MDDPAPTPEAPAEAPSRRRGRKPGKPLTELELATRRANHAKARAALKGGYPPSEKRLRASLANLAKAQAVRRAPHGNAAARLNAVQHGLFAERTLEESVDRLGESKEEFEGCLRLFERGLAAADAEELRLVLAFMELDPFFRELSKLETRIEFWLRKLIRKRYQGRRRWRGFIRVRDSYTKALESTEHVDRFVEYWDTLSPDEQAVVWKEFLKVTGQEPAE